VNLLCYFLTAVEVQIGVCDVGPCCSAAFVSTVMLLPFLSLLFGYSSKYMFAVYALKCSSNLLCMGTCSHNNLRLGHFVNKIFAHSGNLV
jgi:hypothetical protein